MWSKSACNTQKITENTRFIQIGAYATFLGNNDKSVGKPATNEAEKEQFHDGKEWTTHHVGAGSYGYHLDACGRTA